MAKKRSIILGESTKTRIDIIKMNRGLKTHDATVSTIIEENSKFKRLFGIKKRKVL